MPGFRWLCRGCGFSRTLEAGGPWRGACPACATPWDCQRRGAEQAHDVSLATAAATFRSPARFATVPDVDRVLGGGLLRESVILLGGDAGVGKSTLAMSMCDGFARDGRKALYVSAEEHRDALVLVANRLGVANANVDVLGNFYEPDEICREAKQRDVGLVVIDSINQVVFDGETADVGTATTMKNAATVFSSFAKTERVAVILLCQVTKEHDLAGPKVLEHLCDTILYLERDPDPGELALKTRWRTLTVGKHRHGESGASAYLEMTSSGLVSAPQRSQLARAS